MKVCVFGASSDRIDPSFIEEVETLGSLMAENGMQLVYGGGTTGLMGAAARGVKRSGGYVIGISPVMFNKAGVLFPDFDEMILTKNLIDRKELMLSMADAFIAVAGGIGTFDELFEVYAHNQLNYQQKPLVLLNTNGYYDKLWQFINESARAGFIPEESLKMCVLADDCQQAVEIIKRVKKDEGNK